jgi:hypothetical protein
MKVKAGDLVRFRKHAEWVDVFGEKAYRQPGVVLRVYEKQGWVDMQAEVLWSSGRKWSQSITLLEVINGD